MANLFLFIAFVYMVTNGKSCNKTKAVKIVLSGSELVINDYIFISGIHSHK